MFPAYTPPTATTVVVAIALGLLVVVVGAFYAAVVMGWPTPRTPWLVDARAVVTAWVDAHRLPPRCTCCQHRDPLWRPMSFAGLGRPFCWRCSELLCDVCI